jgi:hypothetical protein
MRRMSMDDFVYVKGSKKQSLDIINANYHRCCRENRPHMLIEVYGKSASVSIDCISCDRTLINREEIMGIMKDYAMTSVKKTRNMWWSAGEYTSIGRVPLADAEPLMRKIIAAMKFKKTKPWTTGYGRNWMR